MTVGKFEIASLAREAVPELTPTQALTIGTLVDKAVRKSESHDLRHARFMRKQIGKQLGKAGETIHQLRGQVALLRQQRQVTVSAMLTEFIRDSVDNAVPIVFAEEQIDGTIKPVDVPVLEDVTPDGEADAKALNAAES